MLNYPTDSQIDELKLDLTSLKFSELRTIREDGLLNCVRSLNICLCNVYIYYNGFVVNFLF